MTSPLTLTDTLSETARDAILSGIKAHNDTLLGPTDRRDLFIPITADDGAVDGGLTGYTGRGWLYVELLFVPERLRGRGLAGQLLTIAEEEAKRRGCIGAYIDTINPVACRAYERAGYQVFGCIENFTRGLDICWLIKRFEDQADRGSQAT
ncbi:GNAT family N-acetyltransferase [Rhizobium rhizophilum]|uniref:GNAT family N-acetyltransferase n=1 Tax=Rhizobium rhizophilum TaxID=1850373 RepID=A0ABY2QX39_9HYPH|nr:GNAT family N-acetyltransferase [Rhizobium rhizophilum]THV15630.1 GNAT family N-acetyltransferase [Rhizobium rhizophilum]